MNSDNSSVGPREEELGRKDSIESRFDQTLKNVQGMLKGRSIPGKILLTTRADPLDDSAFQCSPSFRRSFSHNDAGTIDDMDKSMEVEAGNTSGSNNNSAASKLKYSTSTVESSSKEVPKPIIGTRSTDSARVMKFTKELSGHMIILERLRELAWSGVPHYMRPDVWRLLLIHVRDVQQGEDQ